MGKHVVTVPAMDSGWKDRVRELMEARELNMRSLSLKAGLGQTFVRDMLLRDRDPGTKALSALAKALECSMDWIANGTGPSPFDANSTIYPESISSPQIVGEVQAGVWREANVFEHEEMPTLPVAVAPAYRDLPQVAFRVLGSSMNKVAGNGEYVVAVRYIDLGRGPQDGDIAVVERRNGGLVEYTLKRVRRLNGRYFLDPESTDPRYQEGIAADEQPPGIEIEATHKVVLVAKPM
jgi:repressor LexA